MQNDFILPEWAKAAVIYEVNVRQFTEEGNFAALEKHLPRLQAMGIGIIWLMPIFPIGKAKRKGSLGSYYSVGDYTGINPEYGTKEDFARLVKSIHDLGMRIILDWVPNHTSWDHSWISHHPEFYQKNKEGEISDPLDWNGNPHGWEDVAGLNYNNADLRRIKIGEMRYWIENFSIDGFRMDIAYGVPLDFWKECAKELASTRQDVLLLAEADTPAFLNEDAFHIVYGWKFHHLMNQISKGEKKAWDIEGWLYDERPKFLKGNVMHFITNHDENSWNGTEMERMGEAYQAMAVLSMTLDGIPLIYSGQEEPLQRRLKFFDKDVIGFSAYALQDFYTKLAMLRKENSCLHAHPYGTQSERIVDSADVYGFLRKNEESKVVVLLNLSGVRQQFYVKQPITDMYEIYTGKVASFDLSSPIELGPWQFMVFQNLVQK